jgi:Mrp family chromosome partitioning ATPase
VLAGLASGYDLVLVDSPPLLVVGDGLPLLGLVDGVMIVARAGILTHPAATRLRQTIDRVNRIKRLYVVGAVVNDIADELASYSRPYTRAARAISGESVKPSPQHAAS